MGCWKFARKNPELFECLSIAKKKIILLRLCFLCTRYNPFAFFLYTQHTLHSHCSKLPLHKSRIWGNSELNKQFVHTADHSNSSKAFISRPAANSLKEKVGVGEQHPIDVTNAVC